MLFDQRAPGGDRGVSAIERPWTLLDNAHWYPVCKPRRRNLWVVCQRLAVRLIEELPELSAGGLEGSLLFLGVALMENGAAVLDHVGQNFLHWHLSERRRVVEFGDELSA